jgi:hypothetical protein
MTDTWVESQAALFSSAAQRAQRSGDGVHLVAARGQLGLVAGHQAPQTDITST